MFVNPEVPLESLPKAAELDWLALNPKFVRCLQTKAVLRWSVVAIAAGVAHGLRTNLDGPDIELGVLLAGWVVIALGALRAVSWPVLAVPRRGYVVRDKDLVYKAGVLWRSVKAVPYNRVQHAGNRKRSDRPSFRPRTAHRVHCWRQRRRPTLGRFGWPDCRAAAQLHHQ